MKLFNKNKKIISIPVGFTPDDIKIESSICTGEKTIGFYDKFSKKLLYAELVRNDADILAFYQKYGVKKT
ncbi:MAG: hypothetical protein K2K89_01710 [Ruminococcus sp.]|nr:hypothetical protein [Alistipes senegalensis]MDE6424842.1 hypothetical protein [Ruminococcus sp.]